MRHLTTDKGLNERVTTKKKYASNKKWLKKKAEDLIISSKTQEIDDRNKNWLVNYAMHEGRSPKSANPDYAYNEFSDNLRYHDIVSGISKGMLGEQLVRQINPVVVDSSVLSSNFRKRERLNILNQIYEQRFIEPTRQQVQLQWMQEFGILDPYNLTPEQIFQMRSDVDNRLKEVLPQDVLKEMKAIRQSPAELQAKHLLEYGMKEQSIKFKTDKGFENGLVTNLEAYCIDIRNGRVEVEVVNPIGLRYYKDKSKFFINDANWVVYTQVLSFMDVLKRLGSDLDTGVLRRLENKTLLGTGTHFNQTHYESLVRGAMRNQAYVDRVTRDVDFNTAEGQMVLGNLREKLGYNAMDVEMDFTHTNFQVPRKFFYVHRNTKFGIEKFWQAEHYVPHRDDKKIEERWGIETFEATLLGIPGEGEFVKVQSRPWQYLSPDDPFSSKVSYYGGEYSGLFDNSKTSSAIDLGKRGQFRYNAQIKKIEKRLARDHGKVLTITFRGKPDEYDEEQWLDMIEEDGLLVLDPDNMTPADIQYLFKSLDLGQDDKLASDIAYLNVIREETVLDMRYNKARLGITEERTAVRNNQQNLSQSSNQTRFIYYMHDMIVEHVLNGMVNTMKVAVKENPIQGSYILDDKSIIDLEIDYEMLDLSRLGVFITHLGEDPYVVDFFRQNALALVQNSLIDGFDLAQLHKAKSLTEIASIMELASEKSRELVQSQQQGQQNAILQQQQFQASLEQFKSQVQLLMQANDIASSRENTEINSLQLQNAADVNRDGVHDMLTRTEKELRHKERENMKDRLLEREKMQMEKELERIKSRSKTPQN